MYTDSCEHNKVLPGCVALTFRWREAVNREEITWGLWRKIRLDKGHREVQFVEKAFHMEERTIEQRPGRSKGRRWLCGCPFKEELLASQQRPRGVTSPGASEEQGAGRKWVWSGLRDLYGCSSGDKTRQGQVTLVNLGKDLSLYFK